MKRKAWFGGPSRDGESVYYNDVWRTERNLRTVVIRTDGETAEKERPEHTITVQTVTKMKELKRKNKYEQK